MIGSSSQILPAQAYHPHLPLAPFASGTAVRVGGIAPAATPGPQRQNAPDGGAVTEPPSGGEEEEAQRP